MSHIFISYSKTDVDFARYLRRLLEEQGFPVWIDEIGLTASDRWWRTIEQKIDTCAAVVIVMSPAAIESDWVEREILLAEKRKRPLYPVLLAGEAWSRLANIQFEVMTDGLRAKLSPRLVAGLQRAITPNAANGRGLDVALLNGDITELEADVIALKHSADFRGSDAFIAGKLVANGGWQYADMAAQKDDHRWIDTRNVLSAPQALFIGTSRPRHFGYEAVSKLAADAVRIVGEELPAARHMAMTIHGVGFGLDESEAFRAQINGFLQGAQTLNASSALEQVTIVETNKGRVGRLEQVIAKSEWSSGIAAGKLALRLTPAVATAAPPPPPAPPKPYAFVSMPVAAGLEDIYEYGVMGAVHAVGLLCNRLEDTASAEGMEQAKGQIDSASVVIADVSHDDASVWLNVGYAWGKGRPTVLIARHDACPPFLRGVALLYERIKDLETALRGRLGESK